jgi:ubiquinone/menaquinone biosynthesis C-methylase UbiE
VIEVFKDYFAGHARAYTSARPTYPQELFSYLAQITPSHGLARDCATGNGQTAVSLAAVFDQVIATDGSREQIESAVPIANIEYKVALAERTSLIDESIDLITISQALHWFDLDRFFAEVDGVLKPGEVLAVWFYGVNSIEPEVDSLVDELYRLTLKAYWMP